MKEGNAKQNNRQDSFSSLLFLVIFTEKEAQLSVSCYYYDVCINCNKSFEKENFIEI